MFGGFGAPELLVLRPFDADVVVDVTAAVVFGAVVVADAAAELLKSLLTLVLADVAPNLSSSSSS